MKPLERKTRRRLFWVLVAIFIIGTPLLIGYSKGYRLNDALLLIQTGGIYIHSDMENTTVYVNGEYVDTTGAFLRNTYIQELAPNKRYTIWIEREGYQSWVKTLPVYPNLVTEARVLMLPETFEWATVTASTTISVSPTATTTITGIKIPNATSSETTVPNPEYRALEEFYRDDKDQFAVEVATSTYVFIKGKRIATTTTILEYQFPTWLAEVASTTLLETYDMVHERDGILAWLENGDLYATWVRPNEPQPFYFCTATCTPTLLIDWDEPIERYEFFPNRNDVVLLGTSRGVYAVELDARSQRNIQTIVEEPGLDFRLQIDGTLVAFDGTSYRKTAW
jgi:hypothetical protein